MDTENIKVTLQLSPKAWAAVNFTADTLGLNATDVINRAVEFYALLTSEQRLAGKKVLLETSDGSQQLVIFNQDIAKGGENRK